MRKDQVRGRKLSGVVEVVTERGAVHVLSRGPAEVRFAVDAADASRVEVSSVGWRDRWSVVVEASLARAIWREVARAGFERREVREALRSVA